MENQFLFFYFFFFFIFPLMLLFFSTNCYAPFRLLYFSFCLCRFLYWVFNYLFNLCYSICSLFFFFLICVRYCLLFCSVFPMIWSFFLSLSSLSVRVNFIEFFNLYRFHFLYYIHFFDFLQYNICSWITNIPGNILMQELLKCYFVSFVHA